MELLFFTTSFDNNTHQTYDLAVGPPGTDKTPMILWRDDDEDKSNQDEELAK